MKKKLERLHTDAADKLDRSMHTLEEKVRNTRFISKLDVLVEGVRDALLGGTHRRAKQAPFLRDSLGMQRYMIMPIMVCVPLFLFSIWLYGWRALVIVAVTYIFGGLTEMAFVVVRRHEITEGVLVTCMLFALSLPPTIPLWMVAVGIAFGVAIGKEVFGGSGHNIFNPAITGRAFLLIAFPVQLTTQWFEPLAFGNSTSWLGGFLHYTPFVFNDVGQAVDALTAATPLQQIKYEGVTTPFWDLFLGLHPGSLGESSILLLLLGTLVLVGTKIVDWRLTVVMMVTVGVFGQIMYMTFPGTFPATGTSQIMMGGVFFAALLNITDPVTSPMTVRGKWVFSIGIGVLTVLIRALTGYNEGVTFAILLGNMFVPLLDRFTVPKSFAGEAKSS